MLGALSLVLNGGGVAQLKTIASELNDAFEGRESEVQVGAPPASTSSSTSSTTNKDEIVRAIDRVNALSVSLNEQTDDLDLALERPAAGDRARSTVSVTTWSRCSRRWPT